VKDIVNQIDFEGNGRINYSEFIAATINAQDFLTDERVEAIFKSFDTDDNGWISA
jgi:Ca2+-binding EF-hand superfamily protein